jgi:hypothetical protein
MQKERWRAIPGFEPFEASNLGRIRGPRGIMKGTVAGGYRRVCPNRFGQRHLRVQRLVFAAFHGPIPEGFHVHHKDEDKLNNRPGNLEALSRPDHAVVHALPGDPGDRKRKRERDAYRKSKGLREIRRECDCGESFLTFKKSQIYCSEKCRKRAEDRRRSRALTSGLV